MYLFLKQLISGVTPPHQGHPVPRARCRRPRGAEGSGSTRRGVGTARPSFGVSEPLRAGHSAFASGQRATPAADPRLMCSPQTRHHRRRGSNDARGPAPVSGPEAWAWQGPLPAQGTPGSRALATSCAGHPRLPPTSCVLPGPVAPGLSPRALPAASQGPPQPEATRTHSPHDPPPPQPAVETLPRASLLARKVPGPGPGSPD